MQRETVNEGVIKGREERFWGLREEGFVQYKQVWKYHLKERGKEHAARSGCPETQVKNN